MRGIRAAAIMVGLALLAGGCTVHIVGDSTAALVRYYAVDFGVPMTGSTLVGCGYGEFNGNRVSPDTPNATGYASCVIPWLATEPDDAGDYIVAFVSIHDAMCSTVDGCLPPDPAGYAAAHADLVALGYPVYWVAAAPGGGPLLHARMEELNQAVATELGCSLVPSTIREAATIDGLHYTQAGALLVGFRLGVLDDYFEPCA